MRVVKEDFGSIVSRIESIDKRFLEGYDLGTLPQDPQNFLDWWWDNNASNCAQCVLSENRTRIVKPDGVASANIMIVGEGPGFLEDLTGIPIVGPLELRSSICSRCRNIKNCYEHKLLRQPTSYSKKNKAVECVPSITGRRELASSKFYLRSTGSILDGILIDKWNFNFPRHNWIEQYNSNNINGWTHESPWYITNVVLCRSTDSSKIRDLPPESIPRQKCKKWLTMQWAAVNPKIILCFGRVALTVLAGSEKLADSIQSNTLIETKFGPVYFSLHPAYYMRENNREMKALGYAKVGKALEEVLKYAGYPV